VDIAEQRMKDVDAAGNQWRFPNDNERDYLHVAQAVWATHKFPRASIAIYPEESRILLWADGSFCIWSIGVNDNLTDPQTLRLSEMIIEALSTPSNNINGRAKNVIDRFRANVEKEKAEQIK
jgi:hypothetical protein